jgi:CelD/BcsL family acetyltransferase involved in cellulose biosynthesis
VAVGELEVETLASEEALLRVCDEWRALWERHGEGLPFHSYEWISCWPRHFREDGIVIRDRPLVQVFRRERRLVAVAPLMVTRRPARGPGLSVLDFMGNDPNVTELRVPLCDPEWEGKVVETLVEHALASEDHWDWLCLRGLRADRAHLAPGGRGIPWSWGREIPAYVLPLCPTWDEQRSRASRNLKESLRHGYNSLKRDGHSFELSVAREPAAVQAALDRFLELHRARATQRDTIVHGNVFASAVSQAFLRDVCSRFAARDMARVYELRVGDRVVAARVAFALGETLYLYYSGFDPDWGRYGVMTTCVAEIMKDAIAAGFRRVHLSTGTDVAKTRWRPEMMVYRDAVVVRPKARSRFAYRCHLLLRSGLRGDGPLALARRLLGRGFHGS